MLGRFCAYEKSHHVYRTQSWRVDRGGAHGRVTFNKTGRTIFYGDHVFRRIVGGGFKSNYHDETTGDDYWISGPKRRGGDRMYGSALPVEIDDDVRVEYWRDIRGEPERIHDRTV